MYTVSNIGNNSNKPDAAVSLRQLKRSFPTPTGPFFALRGVDLDLAPGEAAAVVGASGSGKSTLLHLLAGIDRPSSGEVWVAGTPLHRLNEGELTLFRGRHVGIVFQFFQLLPTLTALENVTVAMDFVGSVPRRDRPKRALELLARAGVADQGAKLPVQLSGGQQQRVAIARALANDPPLIVADEPTGNLDSRTGEQMLMLLADLARSGKTVMVVTHERDAAHYFSRVVELADGSVIPTANGAPAKVATCATS